MGTNTNLSSEEISELAKALSSVVQESMSETNRVRSYSFAHPDKLSKPNLRALQMVFSGLERSWTGSFSAVLSNKVSVAVGQPEQASFREYIDSLPQYPLLSTLSASPLAGQVFFDMPKSLACSIIDRMAGGTGIAGKSVEMPFTQVQCNIMESLYKRLLVDLTKAWLPVTTIQFAVSAMSISADELENEDNEAILLVPVTVNTGASEGRVNIAIPIDAMEPVLEVLDPQRWLKSDVEESDGGTEPVADLLNSVDMPVSVVLGNTSVSMKDVLGMEVGDVVRLSSTADDSLAVKVGDRVRFRGRPGVVGRRLSVQITEGE